MFPKKVKIRDKKVLKRYGLEYPNCQLCGKQAQDVHHIVYKSAGGNDEAKNLISLCRTCHEYAHHTGEKDYLYEAKFNSGL